MRIEPIAKFTVHKAAEMTPKRRKEIAKWLREQAKGIQREGDNYATRFRAALFWGLT